MRASEAHGFRHVGRVRAARDQRGVAIESAVPDAASLVIALVLREEQLAAEATAQILDVGCSEGELLA